MRKSKACVPLHVCLAPTPFARRPIHRCRTSTRRSLLPSPPPNRHHHHHHNNEQTQQTSLGVRRAARLLRQRDARVRRRLVQRRAPQPRRQRPGARHQVVRDEGLPGLQPRGARDVLPGLQGHRRLQRVDRLHAQGRLRVGVRRLRQALQGAARVRREAAARVLGQLGRLRRRPLAARRVHAARRERHRQPAGDEQR